MGACGSKRAPNVEERSERLHEFFGATIDCEVRPSGLGSAEAVAQDAEQGKAAPSAAAPAAEGGPCVFEGMQPAGINARLSQGALSPEDLEIQRTELKEAAKLIDSMGARGEEAAILAPAEKDGCKYELAINWESSHVALVTQKMQAVPLSMLECVALVREPDLIPLPKWPGLPRIERIALVHEFTPNNVVYHVSIEPWGPFPGCDSVCCAVGFVRTDESGKACVGFARSPPEDEQEVHRGWSVLPKQKRRTRMQVDGCAWVVAPSAEEGKVDVTIFMKTRIPIPHWLVPPALVRWVTPKVFRRILPLLTADKNKEPFRARVAADDRGWHTRAQRLRGAPGTVASDSFWTCPRRYTAVKKQLGLDVADEDTAAGSLAASPPDEGFAAAIRSYDWDAAERLATTAQQKADLSDSRKRVKALEAAVAAGRQQDALALAISPAEERKVRNYFKSKLAASSPRGFFDPAADYPTPRDVPAAA